MAAITDRTSLQAAVTAYLNRSDMTSNYDVWTQLAEQDIERNLLAVPVNVGQSLTAGSNSHAIPSGELISVAMATDSYHHTIKIVSPSQLEELKRPGSGVPYYAVNLGNLLIFDVVVDSAYDIDLFYHPALVPITVSNVTNATLTAAPDVYLYGILKEAMPFLEHDERNILWAQKYQKAVMDENIARERAQYGANPKQQRLPIILG